MPTIKKKAYAAKKRPEQEIVTLAHMITRYVSSKKKVFITILSVAAAVLIVLTGYSLKQSMDEQKAGPLLAAAYEQYNNGSSQYYEKALELFRNVQKKYPSSASGKIAAYYAANCLMNLNRNEEALKEYQRFIKDHSNEKLLLSLVYGRMGYLYRSMGNRAEAIKAFEQAEALAGPGVATYELARMYESAGNNAESQKKYKMIADNLPGTAWAMEAMGKVQKIESLPAPAAQNQKKESK